MYTQLMSWFILCLLSVFALAIGELTQQHLLKGKNSFNPRASAVLTFLFQFAVTVPLILFTPLRDEVFSVFKLNILPQLIVVTIISSLGMIFYLKSFQVKDISLSTIFISSSAIVSTFLGIIFFKESISLIKFLGIFLILISIVSLNFKSKILEKNHLYGLIAAVIFGVAYTLDKSIVSNIDPIIYIFWAFFLVAFFGFLFNPKEVLLSLKGKKITDFKPIVFSGMSYFLYNLFTFKAYVFGGEVGKIDAINNSQIFLIILFEYFILKHKGSIVRKLLTAFVAYIGVGLLGFY